MKKSKLLSIFGLILFFIGIVISFAGVSVWWLFDLFAIICFIVAFVSFVRGRLKQNKQDSFQPINAVGGQTTLNEPAPIDNMQISDSYIQGLKNVAKHYFPNKLTTEQLETVFDMICAILPAVEPIKIMVTGAWAKAKSAAESNAENADEALDEAFSETAFRLNVFLKALNMSAYEKAFSTATEEMLLKAFIATDFYVFTLKHEGAVNLKRLEMMIAGEMLNRGFVASVSKSLTPFEELKAKCYEAEKNAPDADETKAIVIELGKKLLSFEKLYVLVDKDFNDTFPFIGIEGFIEVCSSIEIARNVVDYYHKQRLGHVSIREYVGAADALISFQKMGINIIRLDNGVKPVEINLSDILEPVSNNVIELYNVWTKNKFLRELQYGYRLSKADSTQDEWVYKKVTTEMMLTMRFNAYREFGNGLCYVLNGASSYIEGKTFYTERAFEKAKELLDELNLPETALIADGDSEYAVYNGAVNIRVTRKPDEQDMETSLACSFTGREEAEITRKSFMEYGLNDGVLVITFDELYHHAMQCAGIIVDMPTYGLELKKEEFSEILKWRQAPEKILINIK